MMYKWRVTKTNKTFLIRSAFEKEENVFKKSRSLQTPTFWTVCSVFLPQRWCRWVVIYNKVDYKFLAKINPSPIWDESVFRFKSFFCLTSTPFLGCGWVLTQFLCLYWLVSVFSFIVCVWSNESFEVCSYPICCFIFLAPLTLPLSLCLIVSSKISWCLYLCVFVCLCFVSVCLCLVSVSDPLCVCVSCRCLSARVRVRIF